MPVQKCGVAAQSPSLSCEDRICALSVLVRRRSFSTSHHPLPRSSSGSLANSTAESHTPGRHRVRLGCDATLHLPPNASSLKSKTIVVLNLRAIRDGAFRLLTVHLARYCFGRCYRPRRSVHHRTEPLFSPGACRNSSAFPLLSGSRPTNPLTLSSTHPGTMRPICPVHRRGHDLFVRR